MRDLTARLTALSKRGTPIGSSRLREQVILDLAGTVKQRSSRSVWQTRGLRISAVVAAAFLAVLIGLGTVAMLDRAFTPESPPATNVVTTIATPPTTAVETTPSTTLETAPVDEPEQMDPTALVWTRVENSALGGDGYQSMNAVAYDGDRFVAVGGESSGSSERAAVWTSQDGEEWTRIEDVSVPGDPELAGMNSVIAGGPGFVAVGTIWNWTGVEDQSAEPVVWTSQDGEEWTRIEDVSVPGDAELAGMNSVIAGGPGLIAVGWDFNRERFEGNAVVWTSVDGTSWEHVAAQGTEFSGGEMYDIAPYMGGYVAVGTDRDRMFTWTRGCTSSDECPEAAWTSPDGIVWARVDSDAFVLDWSTMYSVATSGTQIIAVGSQDHTAIWTYDPDTKWALVPHSDLLVGGPYIEVRSIAFDGDRVVAVGLRANVQSANAQGWFDEGDAVVLLSPDRGNTWYRAPADPTFTRFNDPLASMNDIVLVDGGFLVVGSVGDDAAIDE